MKSTANKDGCMREPWNAFAVCSALYVDGVLPIDVLLTLAESVSSRPHRGFWRERAVSVCCSIDITAVSLTESSGRRTSRGGGLPSFGDRRTILDQICSISTQGPAPVTFETCGIR